MAKHRVRRVDDAGKEIAERPVDVSAGAADAGKVAVLGPDGKFDKSLIVPEAIEIKGFTYTHTQNLATTEWVVVHNLNRYPSVTVVDSAGTKWNSEVQYDSPNQLRIIHAVPFSGKAYLN